MDNLVDRASASSMECVVRIIEVYFDLVAIAVIKSHIKRLA
jgi:hypothetical protein